LPKQTEETAHQTLAQLEEQAALTHTLRQANAQLRHELEERERGEEILRQAEQLSRAILNSVPAHIAVLEHPELAEEEKIVATPTLVKELPPPLRRLIGDLSDSEQVLLGLNLQPYTMTPNRAGGRNGKRRKANHD
jgi:hypothetical protein